jgi:hypothetical protein
LEKVAHSGSQGLGSLGIPESALIASLESRRLGFRLDFCGHYGKGGNESASDRTP